jgi:K+/H+ antiporter YhaU regulatory subunit KhtT
VACRSADEEDALRVEGADVVLRPFADAAEQAVDAITSAMHRLSGLAASTPGLSDVRLAPGSVWAGRTIGDLPLRGSLGVTVLAVSRSGRSVLNPGPDFQLFPGDRLILSGAPDALTRAGAELARRDPEAVADDADDFAVRELDLRPARAWHGRSLADLELRPRHGVTAIAVRDQGGAISTPTAHEALADDARLIVAGGVAELDRLEEALAAAAEEG